jgi:hypothetical protein
MQCLLVASFQKLSAPRKGNKSFIDWKIIKEWLEAAAEVAFPGERKEKETRHF